MTQVAARRLVVVEANEIPGRVFEDHIQRAPRSHLARLFEIGRVVETEVREQLDRELYPSQTWYSMNSGVPYAEHGVYWYGDPKSEHHPLYWQIAARAGQRVGLVNTLHSSPLARQCAEGGYEFVIPDCFADDAETLPGRYSRFQRINRDLTDSSGRNARLRPGLEHVFVGASLPLLGVRAPTMARLAALAARIATKRVNKERARIAQAMILADLFRSLCRRHDPDLAVFFTNHVASAMHRYWYAAYPDDWSRTHYSDEWVARYRGEIPAAMDALDRFLGEMWTWCQRTNRTLVVLTSMGQSASASLDTSSRGVAVVRDPLAFASALGIVDRVEVGSAMVPHVHYSFGDEEAADAELRRLEGLDVGVSDLKVDRSGDVLTVTYHLGDLSAGSFVVGGRTMPLPECGITWEPIDDHRSGDHDPRGVMLVVDDAHQVDLPDVIDALDVAPLLLQAIDVAPTAAMRRPVGTL